MKTAAEILEDMSRKKLREGSHEGWEWKYSFAGKINEKPTLQVIEELLAAGFRVKAGYTCTQIRGYHDKWVLSKEPGSTRRLHTKSPAYPMTSNWIEEAQKKVAASAPQDDKAIGERAPYRLGFEIVPKDEDSPRLVGVFAVRGRTNARTGSTP